MKQLPVGEPSFTEIIKGNQLYVDKTAYYHQLMKEGKYFFLSRPRRFGKSLLISTLKELFSGNKELFKGLWIYDNYDFKPNAVILISFTGIDFHGLSLEDGIMLQLNEIAAQYDVSLHQPTSRSRFKELIQALGKEKKVAVLVDEYDKPIIDFLDDIPQAIENRDLLRNFFGVLKDHEAVSLLKFVFITGVSKFTKISLFSELNHLTDLTIERKYAGMCGITQAELEEYFADRIEALREKMNITREELLEKIRHQYNGYTWDGKTQVYNPFSLLRFFSSENFGNYWFASGTASFLVKALKNLREPLDGIGHRIVNEAFFDKYEIENIDIYSLMWQTGYLTIQEVEEIGIQAWYKLGFPNDEVRNAFNGQLLEAWSEKHPSEVNTLLYQLQKALLDGRPEDFVKELKSMFADIPYEALPKNSRNKAKVSAMWEGYFQAMTLLIVKLVGIGVQAEVSKSLDRIDAVFESPKYIYLVEFKLDDSAENAMRQIKEKHYSEAFLTKKKQIFLLALAFSAKTRNVHEHLIESIPA